MNETSNQATAQYLPSFAGNFTAQMDNLTRLSSGLNHSIDDKNPTVKTQLALYDILIPSIGFVIILLNLAVVVSSGLILKKGQQPRSTYLFLGNVAMTDLVTGVAVVFGQLYPKGNRDHFICALQLGMIVSSTMTSVYSVGLIAIDRFLYIVHGIQYQRWVYPTRARLMIVGSWVIGCIIGFMPLFGWYGDTDNGRICWFIFLAPRPLIVLTVLVGIIPILVVLTLYSIILYHALKKIIQLQTSTHNTNPEATSGKNLRMFRGRGAISEASEGEINLSSAAKKARKRWRLLRLLHKKPSNTVQGPSKWKAIKVVLFTTSSFVITWCPYFITTLVYVYTCENESTKRCKSLQIVIASPLAILGFTNSLVNPIIYAWWHKGFRNYVHKRVSIVIMRTIRRHNSVDHSNTNNIKTISSKALDTSSSTDNKYAVNKSKANTDSSADEKSDVQF